MRDDERSLHELLLELDRLEELREDLVELGIRSIEELDARIEELHRLVNQMSGEQDDEHGSV
jgi:L-lactate utilization protein LutB